MLGDLPAHADGTGKPEPGSAGPGASARPGERHRPLAQAKPDTPPWPDPAKIRGLGCALVNDLSLGESFTTTAAIRARLKQ